MIIADEYVATSEVFGQFEIVREGAARHYRFVRYFTSCPVCTATVELANGDPDFTGRIVGRCSESPHEHVFSFDRVTLTGEVLRSPPASQHNATGP